MLHRMEERLIRQFSQGGRPVPILVDYGSGAGREVMQASLSVLEAAGARLSIRHLDGRDDPVSCDSASADGSSGTERLPTLLYRAPLSMRGERALHQQRSRERVRGSLDLYANIGPAVSYAPLITSKHPGMNVIIVRTIDADGREAAARDFDAGEGPQRGWVQATRCAIECARADGRNKVTCLAGGELRQAFIEVAADYPDVETECLSIEAGIAKVVDRPESFAVALLPAAYGDLLSHIAGQLAGSARLAPSAGIGERGAIFEAAGNAAFHEAVGDVADPSALLMAGVMMLAYIGQREAGERISNAWLKTLEDGFHTVELFEEDRSRHRVGTRAFANAVIDRLGQVPASPVPALFAPSQGAFDVSPVSAGWLECEQIAGIDILVHWRGTDPAELAQSMGGAADHLYHLCSISNGGIEIWPNRLPSTACTEQWLCRYLARGSKQFNRAMIVELLRNLVARGIRFTKAEILYRPAEQQDASPDTRLTA